MHVSAQWLSWFSELRTQKAENKIYRRFNQITLTNLRVHKGTRRCLGFKNLLRDMCTYNPRFDESAKDLTFSSVADWLLVFFLPICKTVVC